MNSKQATMEQNLQDMLPVNPVNRSQPSDYPDILTDQEKENIVANAIQDLKIAYLRRCLDLGMAKRVAESRMGEINWASEVDTSELMAKCNMIKHWEAEEKKDRQEKAQKLRLEREALLRKWPARRFWAIIKRYYLQHSGKFDYDQTNEKYIQAVCFLFSGDPRYETELNFSREKGLLVYGSAGLGKTKTLLAVANNPVFPVSVYHMNDIAKEVKDTGACELNTSRIILLDDVGTEVDQMVHYGNRINWFKDFIESYYLKHSNYHNLLITTNLGGNEFESKYGYRVRSRMREMFNTIQLRGDDKRK